MERHRRAPERELPRRHRSNLSILSHASSCATLRLAAHYFVPPWAQCRNKIIVYRDIGDVSRPFPRAGDAASPGAIRRRRCVHRGHCSGPQGTVGFRQRPAMALFALRRAPSRPTTLANTTPSGRTGRDDPGTHRRGISAGATFDRWGPSASPARRPIRRDRIGPIGACAVGGGVASAAASNVDVPP